MRIPSPPYQGPTDELLFAILTGGDCLGYQDLEVGSTPVRLVPPINTVYALIVVEANSLAPDKSKVIRFTEASNAQATPTRGMPLGDLSVYEVKGVRNLINFRAISINAGIRHTMRIQYYG